MPVVSQSIIKPIVPVGAITVTCAFLKPNCSPILRASSQISLDNTGKVPSGQFLKSNGMGLIGRFS